MAKSEHMFIQQETPDSCHAFYEPLNEDSSIQWHEYDSCCSSDEPLLLDEAEGYFTVLETDAEPAHSCTVCAVRCHLSLDAITRRETPSSFSIISRKNSNSQMCLLPLRRRESMEEEIFPNHPFRGIPFNPPLICSEGVGRGNHRLLHRKAWLEVSDSKHRYGKHLRFYHRYWEETQCHGGNTATEASAGANSFFDWLDSQGAYQGQPLPDIVECPRARLDSDTVAYINDTNESQRYMVRVKPTSGGSGRFVCVETGNYIRTGPSGWMFVLRDDVFYAAPKVSCSSRSQRFHHSSFFGGRAVQAAGIFVTCCHSGNLTQILPHSGHYRPGEVDVQRVLHFFMHQGICWTTFSIDVQQFIHVDRSSVSHCARTAVSLKKKKTESLYLRSAVIVADYLSHKARCMQGIFNGIEALRK